MKDVILEREPVELYRILKFEGLAASGGEAKYFISSGAVRVNGVVELRKRKKIICGDVIEFDGCTMKVHVRQADA